MEKIIPISIHNFMLLMHKFFQSYFQHFLIVKEIINLEELKFKSHDLIIELLSLLYDESTLIQFLFLNLNLIILIR